MTAEIIDLWLARKKLSQKQTAVCMYEAESRKSLIDKNCPCTKCREFFDGMQRSTQEIMYDLGPILMVGNPENPKFKALVAELQANSDPRNW